MKNILLFALLTVGYFTASSQCSEISINFTDSTSGTTVYFTDNSATNNGWVITDRRWDFGDNMHDSIVLNPVHTYNLPGTYTVALTVDGKLPGDTANELTCSQTVTKQVHVVSTGITNLDNEGLVIYPNPSNGYIQIKKTEAVKAVYIYNMNGQLLAQTDQTDGLIELPNNTNNDSYFVRVETESRDVVKRILMVR
jgi:PKD repeat protein